jgi:nucleoside-diphosphate-sugar epimerase
MGPTLAVLAKRAAEVAGHELRVVAASRFGNAGAREWLEARGVETAPCDLFDREALGKLPETDSVVFLVGQKFGTSRNPASTWATNTLPPANVVERYPRGRIVALSTGNVYPMMPVTGSGATEETPLTPLGEYANAAVARERVFEYCAGRQGTPLVLLRLNYAVDLRYGVLHDLALLIQKGQPIDLANGWFNCIWQGDANEWILRSLGLATSPPRTLNLTGPWKLSTRDIATQLGGLLGRHPRFTGVESATALFSDTSRCQAVFGKPPTTVDEMIRWTAEWVRNGGRSLDKPTHFEVRDGRY